VVIDCESAYYLFIARVWPVHRFAAGNPFLGLVALGPLHVACIAAGVLGGSLLARRSPHVKVTRTLGWMLVGLLVSTTSVSAGPDGQLGQRPGPVPPPKV